MMIIVQPLSFKIMVLNEKYIHTDMDNMKCKASLAFH